MLNSLVYNIKQGFLQIFRNRGMSLASIFSILAMLLILGMFFVITVNINLFTEVVKQDYDQIEVFLLDDTDKAQAEQIMTQIRTHEGVTDVQYRSKAEALEILKIHIPEEDEFETLNGILISLLDRIPNDDEKFETDAFGYHFEVLQVENKMIKKVKITKLAEGVSTDKEENSCQKEETVLE